MAGNGFPTPSRVGSDASMAQPFLHRRQSWVATSKPAASSQWLLLDNDGSYNGWFDALPQRLRVGPWSPIAWAFLICWPIALVVLAVPARLASPSPAPAFSSNWWADVLVAIWGIAVMVRVTLKLHVHALLMSYTGWSWQLLTARAALAVCATALPASPAAMLLYVGEALRFPVVVGATITAGLWNLALLPLVLIVFMKSAEERKKFLEFNFGFDMTSVHIANVPLAWLSFHHGIAGARALEPADLWNGMVVLYCYALLYVFLLDRLGLHFYPMFSPRTHLCAVAYSLLLVRVRRALDPSRASALGCPNPPSQGIPSLNLEPPPARYANVGDAVRQVMYYGCFKLWGGA
jgi:hypothetical protein